jgi:glycosyltransferase involved in cell wall biosynthesis
MQPQNSSVVHLTSVHSPLDHRIFYKECRSLARAGYDVTLIAPAELAKSTCDGVQILPVPKPRSRWGRPRVWLALMRQTVRLKPTLVHLHDPELLLIAPFLRLPLGRSLRLVYDVHEYFVDSIAQKTWVPRLLRRPVAWLARTAERRLGRVVDGLVFVVEEQAPLYSGWQVTQIVIHNYPEASAFANPTPLPEFPPDRFRLIYVGSLYARRGIMTMLEALRQVVPEIPEVLLILGGAFDSQNFRQQTETFVSNWGLRDHVILVGWIDHARLKDYLVSADVAWLPGLLGQQYQRRSISTKQLECMLMGLPLVTGDHPHLQFFTDQARCGLSVAANDPAAHAEAIRWLYEHPEERREMGKRGQLLVLEQYTWEAEASSLVAFYDQLLKQQTRSRSS